MKVYFISAKKRKTKVHSDVVSFIEKFGYQAIFDLISVNNSQNNIKHGNFDLMIADVEQPSTGLGLSIAMALANRKPVLCLYAQGFKGAAGILPPQKERYLKYLSVKAYNKNNLKDVIRDFLEEKGEQMHNRFNFFISSDISNYLDWIAFGRQQARADFIRRLVRDQMSKDRQYQGYLKNNNKAKAKKK